MNPGKYVVFGLGNEQFGLPIENVEQILKSSKITRIPKATKEILGLFSLRGATIPIVDASYMLGSTSEQKGYFLVVSKDDVRVSLLVDQVHRIIDLTTDQIERTDELAEGKVSSYCGKTDDGLIVLLSPQACLPTKALKRLKEVSEKCQPAAA